MERFDRVNNKSKEPKLSDTTIADRAVIGKNELKRDCGGGGDGRGKNRRQGGFGETNKFYVNGCKLNSDNLIG